MSEGKGRMLRLRHSSSNSLRVGLTKLNLLVGGMMFRSWCVGCCIYIILFPV